MADVGGRGAAPRRCEARDRRGLRRAYRYGQRHHARHRCDPRCGRRRGPSSTTGGRRHRIARRRPLRHGRARRQSRRGGFAEGTHVAAGPGLRGGGRSRRRGRGAQHGPSLLLGLEPAPRIAKLREVLRHATAKPALRHRGGPGAYRARRARGRPFAPWVVGARCAGGGGGLGDRGCARPALPCPRGAIDFGDDHRGARGHRRRGLPIRRRSPKTNSFACRGVSPEERISMRRLPPHTSTRSSPPPKTPPSWRSSPATRVLLRRTQRSSEPSSNGGTPERTSSAANDASRRTRER